MRRADCWVICAAISVLAALALPGCSSSPAPVAPVAPAIDPPSLTTDAPAVSSPLTPDSVAFYSNPASDVLLHVQTQTTNDGTRLITRTIRGGDDDGQITRIATADGPAGTTLLWIEGAGQDARIEFTQPLPQPDATVQRQSSAFADAPLGQPITHTSTITITRGDRRLTGEATQAVTITARDPQTAQISACTIEMTITFGPSRTVTRTQRTFVGTELFTEDRTLKVFVLGVRIENEHEQWSRVR